MKICLNHITSLLGIIGMFIFMQTSCNKKSGEQTGESPLATVYNENLYPQDVKDLFGEKIFEIDTALVVESYILSWVRNKVIEKVALDNILADDQIDELVNDYRLSLIRDRFEEGLLRKHLDTTLTEYEVNQFYELHKDQFPLPEMAIRYYFLKAPRNAPNADKVKSWMAMSDEDTDFEKIVIYASNYGVDYTFENKWGLLGELAAKLPEGSLKDRYIGSSKKDYYHSDNNFRYYYRINEYAEKGSPSPLPMVATELTRVILKKKKIETLKEISDQIYKNELKKNNVKIY